MSETHTVSREQLRAAYEALGLDPALLDDTMEITLTPNAVAATRLARNEAGRPYSDHGVIATVTTVLPIGGSV